MKKIILTLAAAIFAVSIASAQDLASATDLYNSAVEQLTAGNKADAISTFKQALTAGEALGDEGAELVANCKNALPGVVLSLGTELYNEKNFDGALEKINEAKELATAYGFEDVTAKAEELIPTITLSKNMNEATEAFQNKNFAKAAEGFKKVLELDNTNSAASLRLVQCLASSGDFAGAEEALALAEANGQGDNAKKVIGGALLKNAAASLKAGKYADAIEDAKNSVKYNESANAYLIAGQASNKLNKNSEAISWYEKYLNADPNAKNANAITYTVAALYQQAGNKAKALSWYKKIAGDAKFGAQAKQQIEALSK